MAVPGTAGSGAQAGFAGQDRAGQGTHRSSLTPGPGKVVSVRLGMIGGDAPLLAAAGRA